MANINADDKELCIERLCFIRDAFIYIETQKGGPLDFLDKFEKCHSNCMKEKADDAFNPKKNNWFDILVNAVSLPGDFPIWVASCTIDCI